MGLLTILSSSSASIYFTDRKRCKTITVLSPVPVRRKPEQWSNHPWEWSCNSDVHDDGISWFVKRSQHECFVDLGSFRFWSRELRLSDWLKLLNFVMLIPFNKKLKF